MMDGLNGPSGNLSVTIDFKERQTRVQDGSTQLRGIQPQGYQGLSIHHAVGSSRFEKPSLVFPGSFLSTSQPPPQGPIHSPSAKLFGDLGDSVTATPKSNPWDTCTAQSSSAI